MNNVPFSTIVNTGEQRTELHVFRRFLIELIAAYSFFGVFSCNLDLAQTFDSILHDFLEWGQTPGSACEKVITCNPGSFEPRNEIALRWVMLIACSSSSFNHS